MVYSELHVMLALPETGLEIELVVQPRDGSNDFKYQIVRIPTGSGCHAYINIILPAKWASAVSDSFAPWSRIPPQGSSVQYSPGKNNGVTDISSSGGSSSPGIELLSRTSPASSGGFFTTRAKMLGVGLLF